MHNLRSISWLESSSFLKNQFFQLFLRQVIQLHIKLEGCFSYRLNNIKKHYYFLKYYCSVEFHVVLVWGKKIWNGTSQKYLILCSPQGRTHSVSPLGALYIVYQIQNLTIVSSYSNLNHKLKYLLKAHNLASTWRKIIWNICTPQNKHTCPLRKTSLFLPPLLFLQK